MNNFLEKISSKHIGLYLRAKKKRFNIWYYRKSINKKVKELREKDNINVIFVIFELGSWKTESLYRAMLNHKRFNPILVVTPSLENYYATDLLIEYLETSNLKYIYAGSLNSLEQIKPDIVFYQKPYKSCYMLQHWCEENMDTLYCFVEYGLHTISDPLWSNQSLNAYLWQNYFENFDAAKEFSKFMRYPESVVVTGYLPFDRMSLLPKVNPWKNVNERKRIIYAPHHSFKTNHSPGIQYATFLEYGQFMLELAQKYKDKVQWAFKPHPRMYDKLVDIWGRKKTDEYYKAWDDVTYGQVELGVYEDLFINSNALIHDCATFVVEYFITKNPVLFLLEEKSSTNTDNMTSYAKKALDLHYKAYNCSQIEIFVNNVIDGLDPLKDERNAYCEHFLKPPHNKTAADNIINAILGVEEYSIL